MMVTFGVFCLLKMKITSRIKCRIEWVVMIAVLVCVCVT